jgi:hypothetical protein
VANRARILHSRNLGAKMLLTPLISPADWRHIQASRQAAQRDLEF